MNKENYEGLRKQLDNGSLDIPSQITILEIAYKLEQQLQAKQDKEDKLREYLKTWHFEEHFDRDYEIEICSNDILQILNEGSDKE